MSRPLRFHEFVSNSDGKRRRTLPIVLAKQACTCAAREWADAPLGRPICFLPYKIGDTCLNKDWCFSHPASGLSPFVSTFVSYPHGFWFRSALPIALTFTLGDCACMHGDCACMPLCYSNIPKTYSNNSAPAACPRS